jgi:Phosphodiester glycosidase
VRISVRDCVVAKRRLLAAIATLAGLAALPAQALAGPASFVRQIHWTSSSPVRGVQLLAGTFTDARVQPQWTVTLQAPTQSPFDGSAEVAEAGSRAWARQTVAALAADGFTAQQTTLSWPRYADDPRGFMGIRVRVGEFATQAAATAQASTLTADGFKPLVEWQGFDPQNKPDAELLHGAIVDPQRFAGRVIATHGPAVAARQTVATEAQALRSLVAVNAGFFTINAALPGVGGVPTGLGLVLFTAEFGAPLPTGAGVQAIVDPQGRVISVGAQGGSLPAGDSAVQAIGIDATWLSSHLRPGKRVQVTEQLRRLNGSAFNTDRQTSIVSAAPVLLRDGRVSIDASTEGVFDPRDLNNYSFSADRHARTIAGVDPAGQLILVTADGIPTKSEGLTLTEEAKLMRSLGATDAINLDGGGSTSFVVNGSTINMTSDATGPRAIGDSIQVVP